MTSALTAVSADTICETCSQALPPLPGSALGLPRFGRARADGVREARTVRRPASRGDREAISHSVAEAVRQGWKALPTWLIAERSRGWWRSRTEAIVLSVIHCSPSEVYTSGV